MLDQIEARHFVPLQGQAHSLILPDGRALAVRLDSVGEQPRARMPNAAAQRMPFVVTLTALEPTAFIDGACSLELPELGTVSGIWVGRMASLGRDPAGAYFQIVFN